MTFNTTEKHLSQIPALQLLAKVGYRILTPEQALQERGGKTSNVLLEGILREQLSRLNRIHLKGQEYHFSEANLQEAIQKLKNVNYDGLLRTNEVIYDLITLGIALEQTVEGHSKSFNLNYIDWKIPANNVFHVVAEFAVERARSVETARPDLVLFVNGIPLCVIECKAPQVEVEQAISQNIRNQGADYIPQLFTYVQLILGMNKNATKYATTGTPEKFWSVWKEHEDQTETIESLVNRPLSEGQKSQLFVGALASARKNFDALESKGKRLVTEQDKAIYSLCRPARLLELTHRFTLFENGEKKIARYQQFFVVRSTMQRVKQRNAAGNRTGGVIWHTQGSGKSLTMVWLTRALALDTDIKNPRILLVTDRNDLDKQLGNTFTECGLSKKRATSGRNLVKHLKDKVGIITTLIHKFDKGWASEKFVDDSADIFVLVDESHRTNLGSLAEGMRQMLPNSCYLGFTGTPLLKKEKNTFVKFGGLIDPHYSIRQAVQDQAILPLLYEGRHVEMEPNQSALDLWFERHTSDLTPAQQADLKQKYAHIQRLNQAEQVIHMRAFDLSEHYRANWQGTGFKAQLVAPSKATAIRYHRHLQAIGFVTSEVIISAPDTREGHEAVDEGPTDEVGQFWNKMKKRFGSEETYNKQIIGQFKHGEEPEILIVVNKLLTGFDAPKNTVMYLCCALKEHTLLQAIARVNRLHEGKEFGYIVDYASILGELDKALTLYDALAGFDEDDLAETLISINEQVQRLPDCHSHLWGLFRTIKNKHDEEEFEQLLADDELREDFYERLSKYSKTLSIALSTEKFIRETEEAKLRMYKSDLKRFQNLKVSVKRRYAESGDYRDYEPKIKKLLDTHIQANDAYSLHKPIDIFDEEAVSAVMEESPVYGTPQNRTTAANADAIAHATKKVIHEKMDEDPAFYAKFSKLIQQAIDDFKAQRLSDWEYRNEVYKIRDQVVSRHHEEAPESIRDNEEACAYYGMFQDYFAEQRIAVQEAAVTAMATAFQNAFAQETVVDFWHNADALNHVKSRMDDFFYDVLKEEYRLVLAETQMDEIIEKTMQIAKNRRR